MLIKKDTQRASSKELKERISFLENLKSKEVFSNEVCIYKNK